VNNVENKVNRNRALALAVGLGAALPVGVGHAGPTVYGQLNVSVDNLDNGTHSGVNVSSNSSRFGIKGDIQVGGDLAAIYQIESEVNVDTANLSSPSGNPQTAGANTSIASRNTFLGLKSAHWGTVRLGRFDTPVKSLGRKVDLFADQVGDARNLTRGANAGAGGTQARFDERPDNSIAYTSPDWLGLVADLHYATNVDSGVAGTTTGAATNGNQDKLLSAAVSYARGPGFIGVGYEKIGFYSTTAPSAGNDPDIVRVAGSYDLGPARINALWQTVKGVSKTVPEDEDVYGLGLSFKAGDDWLLKAQGYQLSADADDKDVLLLAVGAEYTLQKGVTLYADYASADNDDARALVPYGQGRSDNLGGAAAGDSPSAVSLGAIVKF
jgi:predicted porin